jgi:Protein of unknown function (DUF2971)
MAECASRLRPKGLATLSDLAKEFPMETATPTGEPVRFDNQKLVTDHPELHHYTTKSGLDGILKCKTIWATHFSDLNDSTEVKLLKAPLAAVLTDRIWRLLLARQHESLGMRKRIQKFGGVHKVAANLATGFVASMYQVTFDTGSTVNFGSPFIASFCSHVADQEYEREHGLLSQWRGYGREGGFCIVFDTAKLVGLLAKEFTAFDYVHMNIDSARYSHQEDDISGLFPELVHNCEKIVSETLKGNMRPSGDGLASFLAGATLYKHRGFYEEREIRIVAIPSPKELQNRMLKENKNIVPRPIKPINTLEVKHVNRRYISLLEGLNQNLPIRRIIVGPSRHQQENLAAAKGLIGNEFSVSASATPFVG